jgi:hypothetical protein
MLKNLSKKNLDKVFNLINISVTTGYVPSAWNLANLSRYQDLGKTLESSNHTALFASSDALGNLSIELLQQDSTTLPKRKDYCLIVRLVLEKGERLKTRS